MGRPFCTEITHEDETYVYFGHSMVMAKEALYLPPTEDWSKIDPPLLADGAKLVVTKGNDTFATGSKIYVVNKTFVTGSKIYTINKTD